MFSEREKGATILGTILLIGGEGLELGACVQLHINDNLLTTCRICELWECSANYCVFPFVDGLSIEALVSKVVFFYALMLTVSIAWRSKKKKTICIAWSINKKKKRNYLYSMHRTGLITFEPKIRESL